MVLLVELVLAGLFLMQIGAKLVQEESTSLADTSSAESSKNLSPWQAELKAKKHQPKPKAPKPAGKPKLPPATGEGVVTSSEAP